MLSSRLQKKSPLFAAKLEQMAISLRPLVSLTQGEAHPDFPYTLLNYWLLTSSQLDDLAHFYHQRTPSTWTYRYPCPVTWRTDATLEEKRRRIGRFIGLKGCDSPTPIGLTEEQVQEEVRKAREKNEEEEMFARKRRGY
ncbi:beta-xylosidase [Glarea lozoyensis ATCC 20868]|uniref:Beta-xylosidase n=1 Tax=Glarea lozoyensis (strain ATCC 20868 / MF5171) TaxID=1116229 RepID=S3DB90_GLAL2|nr:beta-xylosidase [Glarea lozoyensis ATCC 20868]EPE29226.1 beta-xylosidase [Glarea lozoyensis ATCC 20868]